MWNRCIASISKVYDRSLAPELILEFSTQESLGWNGGHYHSAHCHPTEEFSRQGVSALLQKAAGQRPGAWPESLGDAFRAVFLEVLSIWTSKPRRIKAASMPTERLQAPSPYRETIPLPLQALPIASMNPFRLSAKMGKRMRR